MKKTLNINIGNSIIHIEEDACEMLHNYLVDVKHHFGRSADDFEIVSDIENRIAEMLREILSTQQKPVIELADIQVVIELMGTVKDFETETEEEPSAPYNSNTYSTENVRKIFRDTEGAVIAGVCSGLGHYLRMDVSILRVLAVLSVFLGGSGLVAYLILWVSIPRAISRSEKMAMKGETFNLQGFKKNFEEELSNLKDNFKNAGDQMRPLVKQSRSFIAEFADVLATFIQGAGRTFFKIVAVIIMFMGSIMMVAVLITLAALLGFWDSGLSGIFPLNIIEEVHFSTFIIAVFFTAFIPLLALILLSIRLAFQTRTVNTTLSYVLLLLWLGALGVSIFYAAKTSTEFKDEAEFTQNLPIQSYPAYTLTLDKSRFFSKEDSLRYHLNSAEYSGKVISIEESGPFQQPRSVSIHIEKSENNTSSIMESYSAKGINFETALYHAKNIRYDFTQKDSLLKFSPEIQLKKSVNWRAQQLELVLKVPVGTVLKIDKSLDRYMQGYNLWECINDETAHDSAGNANFYVGIMTDDGLKCKLNQQ